MSPGPTKTSDPRGSTDPRAVAVGRRVAGWGLEKTIGNTGIENKPELTRLFRYEENTNLAGAA
eukprot:7401594-Pyramimonas_sp.AAC.1